MNCSDRDSDILLLAHRQSDVATGTITLLHLLHCSRCRTRYHHFVHVQDMLIRGTRTAFHIPSAIPANPWLTGVLQSRRMTLIALITLITLLASVLVGASILSQKKNHHLPSPQNQPCRPDIPGDQCN